MRHELVLQVAGLTHGVAAPFKWEGTTWRGGGGGGGRRAPRVGHPRCRSLRAQQPPPAGSGPVAQAEPPPSTCEFPVPVAKWHESVIRTEKRIHFHLPISRSAASPQGSHQSRGGNRKIAEFQRRVLRIAKFDPETRDAARRSAVGRRRGRPRCDGPIGSGRKQRGRKTNTHRRGGVRCDGGIALDSKRNHGRRIFLLAF